MQCWACRFLISGSEIVLIDQNQDAEELKRVVLLLRLQPQQLRDVLLEDWCFRPQASKFSSSRGENVGLITLFRPAEFTFTRFRDFITSVLRLIGLALPCSLRKRPHALHRTAPFSSLRQRGVYVVVQFPQTGYWKGQHIILF